MKKPPAHILLFFFLLYSCEVENSASRNNIGSSKSKVATDSPRKHQLDQSSKTTIFAEYAQPVIVVDSTQWMDAMHSISKPEEEMLYINTRWEIIDKESFLDSVTMANYGSIALSSNTMGKASKLKKITSLENNPVPENLIKYEGFSLNKVPDSLFIDLSGTIINNTILDRKLVVLNFWSINCKGCMVEIPHLNKLVDKYKSNKEVIFLAPSMKDSSTRLINFSFTKSFKYRLTTVKDRFLVENAFKVNTYPTNMVIGKNGKVRYVLEGGSAAAVKLLDLAIEKALIENTEDL